MRYFAVLFLLLTTQFVSAQQLVKGKIINDQTKKAEANVSIINLSNLKVSKSNSDGFFEIMASINDTLHLSLDGYRSQKVRVTSQWLSNNDNLVYFQDDTTVLDELFINDLNLTGILSVDTKLIAIADYPFNRDFAATGFSTSYFRGLNPLNGIYNALQKNNAERKKIDQVKKEVELIELMKSKFDRETVSALLSISKEEIVTILQRCNQTERFIYTASDYQIFNAINECYDSHKLLK